MTKPRPSAAPAMTAARGKPYDDPIDWSKLLILGAGIAAGAAIGAGTALLLTSRTGPERRARLARTGRRLGHSAGHAWDDLAFELQEAARATRDRFRHRHTAGPDDDGDEDDD